MSSYTISPSLNKNKIFLLQKSEVDKQLDDYPIFMAIAEDIGYDAAGRSTGKNELPEISKSYHGLFST